jgi:thiamine pyrophosphokinase
MDCNHDIEFNITNFLASTLGFEKQLYSCLPYDLLTSMSLENIQYKIDDNSININSIKVLCNIAKGSFENGQHSNSIYEFFPKISTLE